MAALISSSRRTGWVKRRLGDGVRVGVGFFQDFGHGVDEVAYGFLGFGFCGLDQETLGHQQRDVDGGGVLVVVEQALGDVERGDVLALAWA